VLAEADVTITTVLFRSILFDRPIEAAEGTDPASGRNQERMP
jgi:hypothetical protein